MFKFKRVISLVLVFVIVFGMAPSANATGTPTIAAEKKTAFAGDEVEIALVISDNPGIGGLSVDVKYASGLTLVGTKDTGLIDGGLHGTIFTANPYKMSWNVLTDDTDNGKFMILTFKVDENVKPGSVLEVEVIVKEAFNNNFDDVSFAATNGTITVNCAHKTLTETKAKAATCTEDGNNAYYTCTCGVVLKADKITVTTAEAEIIGSKGHTDTVVPGKEATCTETGLTDGKKCSVCDHVITAQTEIPVKPHTETDVPAVPATCTATGLTAGKKCSVCGTVTKAQETVDKVPHTEVDVPAVPATCTATGLTAGKKCSVCGTVTKAQETVDKVPHTEVDVPAVPATCTATGLTAGKKCSVCGTVTKAQETVDKLAHTEETIPAKAATCTATGLTEGKKCSVCGTVTVEQKPVDKLAHTEETIPAKAATCTEAGLTEGKKCSVCGTVTVEQKPIEKLGHKEEVIKGKAATCTETGLTDGKKCATCGTVTVKQETIPANGHKWVDATCTAPKTCVVCDVTEGTKLGHNYSSEWSKNETNHYHACSRCDSKVDTAAHTYKDDKDETCEVCGYERGHIHSLTKVGAVAATCTESGNKEYYTCSGCDVWFEDAAGKTAITDKNSVVIKAAGHTYDKATWTWDGTTAASVSVACSVCDNKATTKATVTSEVTTAATCTADGVRTYTATATVGGKTFTDTKTEAIEATGHNFKNGKCTVCGAADPDYVAPTEPTEPPVTEPPVTEPPVTEPPVTEPPVTEPPVTEPPVTEPPVTEPPHTHSFGAWVTVKDPSSKEAGKEERTCACGEKETREIPKLSNPFKDVNNKNYYYEPVLWAVNKGITAGTEKDSFGPNDPCTRAQIVTFLWRAAGSPEPKADAKNPFTDVKTTDYYYKAVLWAVEKGITSGVSATKFGSGAVCTRAQVVTFLWRAAGSPAAKGTNPFTDVKTTDYYCQAVLWAVEKGITAGTSATTFGSNENCVRGQIVTFLYKAYAK